MNCSVTVYGESIYILLGHYMLLYYHEIYEEIHFPSALMGWEITT